MKTFLLPAGAISALAALSVAASAGPERIVLPADYQARFVQYETVDKPDRKIIRFMYVSPEANAAVAAGKPAPNGTVLIMEDHPAELGDDGQPKKTPDGRLVPQSAVSGLFVMEKREGWGESIPAELRNGDWDYAAFDAGGKPRENMKYDRCCTCHKAQAEQDFTFTYFKAVQEGRHRP